MAEVLIFKNAKQCIAYAVRTRCSTMSFRPSGFMWHDDLSIWCNHGV